MILTPFWANPRAMDAPFPQEAVSNVPDWPMPVIMATFPFRSGYVANEAIMVIMVEVCLIRLGICLDEVTKILKVGTHNVAKSQWKD